MELNEIAIGLIIVGIGWVLNKLGISSDSDHHGDDDGFTFYVDFDGDDD